MDQTKLHEHWQHIWENQKTDFRAVAINKLIAGLLRNPADAGNVLDVGCGACGMTLNLMKSGYSVTSIDTSASMLAMGRHYLELNDFSPERVHETTAEEFAPLNRQQFDQLVCLDVIEHVADDGQAVSAMLDMLKPGGRMVLTVPAMPSLYGPKDVDLGHYRRYDSAALAKLFQGQACTITSIRYWNFLGVPVTWAYNRLLHKKVDESVRYGTDSVFKKVVASLLRTWFLILENNLRLPAGLTLILVAEKNRAH